MQVTYLAVVHVIIAAGKWGGEAGRGERQTQFYTPPPRKKDGGRKTGLQGDVLVQPEGFLLPRIPPSPCFHSRSRLGTWRETAVLSLGFLIFFEN
ncbi:hypothetical protein FKM82_019156 [Ascaphus truei]